jgi:cyclopropane-fatty-acyl-phospholipid synthase
VDGDSKESGAISAQRTHGAQARRPLFVPRPASQAYDVVTLAGERRQFGSGSPEFVVRVPDLATWSSLLSSSPYRLATAFVAGDFEIDGDLIGAIRWWHTNHVAGWFDWMLAAFSRLKLESWIHTKARARRNIRFHYDRSNLFYQQFLDSRMVYSSALFADPSWSLDEAQVAKLDYICRKLDVRPDDFFLDVGCGWGALLIHAADRFGASTVGCTLSGQQLEYARAAAAERGLQGRVLVDDIDYRDVPGRFDKIASVGMYEHVGRRRLVSYFRTMAGMLEPDGLFLNHGIARPQDTHDDGTTVFLRRYVFPGGELPNLSDIVRCAERAGFEVLDVENLRPHYVLTCSAWVANLLRNRDRCLALVDAATYRTWLLYLAAAAVSFERGQTELYQTLLAKRSAGAFRRLSRSYMAADALARHPAPDERSRRESPVQHQRDSRNQGTAARSITATRTG